MPMAISVNINTVTAALMPNHMSPMTGNPTMMSPSTHCSVDIAGNLMLGSLLINMFSPFYYSSILLA
jgi:hypothetical protein